MYKKETGNLNSRKGFTVLFIFLVLLVVIYAEVNAQSHDLQRIARLQKKAIELNGRIRPAVDPRLSEMIQQINNRQNK